MKVCVYAICKNESQFVERWMASMGEADAVVVLDTGSTGGGGAGDGGALRPLAL